MFVSLLMRIFAAEFDGWSAPADERLVKRPDGSWVEERILWFPGSRLLQQADVL